MCRFTQSKTYALLLDASTGLLTQSPDYNMKELNDYIHNEI